MDFSTDIGRMHTVKRIGISFIISAALCLAASVPAMAASASLPAGKRAFSQLDGNKDGKLTVEELSPRAAKRLDAMTDKDGAVSKSEIDAAILKQMEGRRDRLRELSPFRPRRRHLLDRGARHREDGVHRRRPEPRRRPDARGGPGLPSGAQGGGRPEGRNRTPEEQPEASARARGRKRRLSSIPGRRAYEGPILLPLLAPARPCRLCPWWSPPIMAVSVASPTGF